MLCKFWHRLRLRGYPARVLYPIFRNSPGYADRDSLLAPPAGTPDTDVRLQVCVLEFSRALHAANLCKILHEHRYLLPEHLRRGDAIIAWRAPRKLGRLLIPYRFPDIPGTPSHDHDTPRASAASSSSPS